MPIDKRIVDLVDKGMSGEGLTEEEGAELLSVNPYTFESAHIRWGGYMLARKASGGMAEVHAQIGMDASACPKNCQFCSFAACNGLRPPKAEMPKDEVIEYAKAYNEAGVNLMCLMVTAAYDFDKFLDMGASVREVINPDMPLMANIDDFSYEQAVKLKEAGFDAVYHVVHMGEGKITTIKPETRIATMENAKKAGLKLSSCVEPIGPEHTPQEISKHIHQLMKLDPLSTGVGLRVPVPGSPFANDPHRGAIDWSFYMACMRLIVGLTPKLCGNADIAADSGANYGWAEVGTNPRDDSSHTDKTGIGRGVKTSQYNFMLAGWQILEGPSQGWRE